MYERKYDVIRCVVRVYSPAPAKGTYFVISSVSKLFVK